MTSDNVCPVCNGKAMHLPNHGDYVELDCSSCGHFRVSGSALASVPNLATTEGRRSLDRARLRAHYGSLPLITTYDLP